MMHQRSYSTPVTLHVWGERACFTRPEAKIERVSYELPTPAAARGILEAIFWHPEFSWHIREIQVWKPIRHFSLLRNEIRSRASPKVERLLIGEERTQRHTLGLRDVAYKIMADVIMRPGVTEDAAKYRDQFRRSVSEGKCRWMPYLGCREWSVSGFGDTFPPEINAHLQEDLTVDLGLMFFDFRYKGERTISLFFPARLEQGVLIIPQERYREVFGDAVTKTE